MEINNNLEDEIDLRDLINHLIKSKIIIIITTFIFALIAASYNYLAPKQEPIYQTTVKLIIGTRPDDLKLATQNIQDIGTLIDRVSFYFPEPGAIINSSGNKFLEIKLVGPSIEKNTYSLTEMANYVISNSEDIIDASKRGFNREISNISNKIENLFISLDSIPINYDLNTDKELLMYYVITNKEINELLDIKELMLTRQKDTNLFSSSSIFGDILSVQLRQTQDKSKINILFSAIAGLLLSIFVILFRHIFLKKQE